MNIGFTGHRDRAFDETFLIELAAMYPAATWIHGGAIGFDSLVEKVAKQYGVKTIPISPDYKQFGRYRAPHIRNRQIVDQVEVMIAGYDGRDKGGTCETIKYAESKGTRVITLQPDAVYHVTA